MKLNLDKISVIVKKYGPFEAAELIFKQEGVDILEKLAVIDYFTAMPEEELIN